MFDDISHLMKDTEFLPNYLAQTVLGGKQTLFIKVRAKKVEFTEEQRSALENLVNESNQNAEHRVRGRSAAASLQPIVPSIDHSTSSATSHNEKANRVDVLLISEHEALMKQIYSLPTYYLISFCLKVERRFPEMVDHQTRKLRFEFGYSKEESRMVTPDVAKVLRKFLKQEKDKMRVQQSNKVRKANKEHPDIGNFYNRGKMSLYSSLGV